MPPLSERISQGEKRRYGGSYRAWTRGWKKGEKGVFRLEFFWVHKKGVPPREPVVNNARYGHTKEIKTRRWWSRMAGRYFKRKETIPCMPLAGTLPNADGGKKKKGDRKTRGGSAGIPQDTVHRKKRESDGTYEKKEGTNIDPKIVRINREKRKEKGDAQPCVILDRFRVKWGKKRSNGGEAIKYCSCPRERQGKERKAGSVRRGILGKREGDPVH